MLWSYINNDNDIYIYWSSRKHVNYCRGSVIDFEELEWAYITLGFSWPTCSCHFIVSHYEGKTCLTNKDEGQNDTEDNQATRENHREKKINNSS